ncbi:hypothetical protein [Aerolutibacter ruishenii]|nr:hypothetical protein [Lysobacter ruishenii]
MTGRGVHDGSRVRLPGFVDMPDMPEHGIVMPPGPAFAAATVADPDVNG